MVLFLSIVISILILFILFLITKYYSLKKQSKNMEYEFKRSFIFRELTRLQEQVSIFEKREEEVMIKTSTIGTEKIKYNPIFKDKKAIIGNYDTWSSEQTRKILRSFGISVDVVRKGEDIVDRIKNDCKYDIIFTNNIYQRGIDGINMLKQLKQIDGFSTPVVIHTITEGERDYFLNSIGFDEYITKPIRVDDLNKITEIENILKKLLCQNRTLKKES